MVLVLLSTLSSATIEENRSRIAVYKMLGANDKKVKLSFWLEGFLYWAIASVFALLLLYSIWITEEIQLMGFVYPLRYYLFPVSYTHLVEKYIQELLPKTVTYVFGNLVFFLWEVRETDRFADSEALLALRA